MNDEPRHQVVHFQTPWWQRPWFALTVLLVVATGFFFGLGQWVALRGAQHTADNSHRELVELRSQQTETKGEQECRADRSAAAITAQGDLLKNMSDLVGFLAARQPDQVPALMEERDRLSAAYAAARENLATAVEACKAGVGN